MEVPATPSQSAPRPQFLRAGGWCGPELLTDTLIIIGCGAIGSNVAMIAAKMGWSKFDLWDNDVVEAHNPPNQAYLPRQSGLPKVEALAAVLKDFNPNISVACHNTLFDNSTQYELNAEGPLVIATDSMSSRKEIIEIVGLDYRIPRIHEVRLGFDYGEVHTFDNTKPEEISNWKTTLRDDSEIPDGPCNLKICIDLVLITSAFCARQLSNKYAIHKAGEVPEYDKRTAFHLDKKLIVHKLG